ncbi:MAG: hypothetical protein N2C14_15255 [Planctomycetales bacterium]
MELIVALISLAMESVAVFTGSEQAWRQTGMNPFAANCESE